LFGAPEEIAFHAKQFHFHSPSEHAYDGALFDLEMHTVHLED
jgi:carbonic anhydrase